MLRPDQARAYAEADFEAPHGRFIELLRERHPGLRERGRALDLGCGPADITLRFLRAFPGWSADAVDGSPAMLEWARRASAEAGLGSRIRLFEARIPDAGPPRRRYDLLLSNSLLHHLADPSELWRALARSGWSGPGSRVFVMDLLRPESVARARELVDRYAASEPEVLRDDFYHSLRAAYRIDEVRAQLARAGLGHLELEVVSDRHFIVWGRLRARGSGWAALASL